MTAEENKMIDEMVAYYDSLPRYVTPPKTELLEHIMAVMSATFANDAPSEGTIRNWLTGKTKPIDSRYLPLLGMAVREHKLKTKN